MSFDDRAASYYRDMQRYFGPSGQVSLGDTTMGTPPYNELSNLVNDVRMLAGLGATAIPIYDLSGTVSHFGAEGLKVVVEAGRNPMTGSELASMSRQDPYSAQNRAFFRHLDTVATASTTVVTASQGDPREPNAYPNGCGNRYAS